MYIYIPKPKSPNTTNPNPIYKIDIFQVSVSLMEQPNQTLIKLNQTLIKLQSSV